MSFTEIFGTAPAGAWAAPGRVNLIGEHTDYNDGFVLPFAIAQRTTVEASVVDSPEWTVWSEQTGELVTFDSGDLVPGKVGGWAGYVAGIVWALRRSGLDVPGARLAITSNVPVGAGLSSSHAMGCAVLTALVELGGLDLALAERPKLAQVAENDYVGAPTGIMDQSASILCRPGYALFLDCRTLSTEHIPFDAAEEGLAVLVVNTNAPHRNTDSQYAERRRTCEAAAARLGLAALRDVTDLGAALAALPDDVTRRRVRHVVTENQRVLETVLLLRKGKLTEAAPLLTASHISMRDDYEISVPEVDTAVSTAIAAGAYGARMTGAGFGGCVVALVDRSAVDEVSGAVAEAFAANRFTAPTSFVAVPSGGAARVRLFRSVPPRASGASATKLRTRRRSSPRRPCGWTARR